MSPSKRRMPRGLAPSRRSEPNASARKPRLSSFGVNFVNCGGAPAGALGGDGG
jgi:hypothetical protein